MTPHPLLARVDQIITQHNLSAVAAGLQADLLALRAEAQAFIDEVAEIRRLHDEAVADNDALKVKVWIQRLTFALSKLLTLFDHHT